MSRSLFFFSILWLCLSSDCLSQSSSTWTGARLDTLTLGNSDEFNPVMQKNTTIYGHGTYCWLAFERHTAVSSDIMAKRFLSGGTWDTTNVLIAASTSTAEQTRPNVAGFAWTPSIAAAAWQKKVGGVWNVYYSFCLADSLRWQAPQALTTDSVDCYDVRVLARPDTSFIISWKRKRSILFARVASGYRSMTDTAATSNIDSAEYDLAEDHPNGGSIFDRTGLILFTRNDSTDKHSLWQRVFWPDTMSEAPSIINANGLSVLHPRYVQGFFQQPWFTFAAYDGSNRDIWGIDYSGLSRITQTPMIDERNCSAGFFPIMNKQAGTAIATAFLWTHAAYEADSTVVITPGDAIIASAGYNRAPVLNGYAFPEGGFRGGFRIVAVWESNRSGRTHLYSKNIFQPHSSVSRESYEPAGYALSQNYPNPFNPVTTFRFSIPSSQMVNLKIFDILGREVTTLANEHFDAGLYRVNWNAAGLISGTYFAVMKTPFHSEIRKIILLK